MAQQNALLFDENGIKCYASDYETVVKNGWLEDIHIQLLWNELEIKYANLLEKIVFITPIQAQLAKVSGWDSANGIQKKIETEKECRYVFIPVNTGKADHQLKSGFHWVLLLFDKEASAYYTFDSLHSRRQHNPNFYYDINLIMLSAATGCQKKNLLFLKLMCPSKSMDLTVLYV